MNSLANNANQQPLLLLDGMSLAFRAFYALSVDIQTSSGLTTNALHGFASMLLSLVKTQQPRSLVVAFDLPGGTFRDSMAPDYKGGRGETPPEIEHQFDLIKTFCERLNIPVLGVTGYEADDVLATLATWGRDNKLPVIVVTGDRDTFQLVEDPFVRVLYNKRGVSDYDLYDEAGIFDRCGVEPKRYTLLAAMRGDTSDNLPGVPGVGEKTAAKLLAQFKDFDDLYSHVNELTPKLKENLIAYEERARTNAKIMQLVRDVPLEFKPSDVHLGGWDFRKVSSFFDDYEMTQMKARYEKALNDGLFGSPRESSKDSVSRAQKQPSNNAQDSGVALKQTPIAAMNHEDSVISLFGDRVVLVSEATNTYCVASLDDLFKENSQLPVRGHDVKELFRLAEDRHIDMAPPLADSAVMSYLIDSIAGEYSLASVADRFLGESIGNKEPSLLSLELDEREMISTTRITARLIKQLEYVINEMGLEDLYRKIELPLVRVLGRMESRGISVNVELLRKITKGFSEESEALDREIQEIAGHPFKVNSPTQLQKVLFEELKLTSVKKIKTGFSTDAASLEAIEAEHEIIPKILRYREVEKLRSTYGDSLAATVASDGRIHASFNQMVARTGRLSSENPNLHNIPVRSEDGKRLRLAFTPQKDWLLAVADYNQIELRILAHLSGDKGLTSAFNNQEDVHRTIASFVFKKPISEISNEEREISKAVSYGLAYGMEAYGLSQRLKISVGEAKSIMKQYFSAFPSLHEYMQETVRLIRQQGFSRTEMGRIRPFPDLATATGPARAASERQAMNAGIQGLAADVFKSALVRLDDMLEKAGLSARLILQVHDEVLVEAPTNEQQKTEAVIREALVHAADLRVPLEVSLHWGDNWAEAKG